MDDSFKITFLEAADLWVCDDYSYEIRYLADRSEGECQVVDAQIVLGPIPTTGGNDFEIEAADYIVGNVQNPIAKREALMELLGEAVSGRICVADKMLLLIEDDLRYYSETIHRDKWFSELSLRVSAGRIRNLSPQEVSSVDSALRRAEPPFDGLTDVSSWLGLAESGSDSRVITIKVLPPVDVIIDESSLSKERLHLTLHAHPNFNRSHISLAVRATPGSALHDARKQIASQIKWGDVRDGRRVGTVQVDLKDADAALAILLIGDITVRRQWFVDPSRARNHRLLAIQTFDKDLKMIRQALMESPDSSRFENGVAALLFLLGFAPSVQIETDAPDLIVTTPSGRIVLVECTTRIADFKSKLGKLVDRRGAVTTVLEASGHSANVIPVLVCRLPKEQIAADERELRVHGVLLVTKEELASGLERVRFPSDPDKFLEDALAHLTPGQYWGADSSGFAQV